MTALNPFATAAIVALYAGGSSHVTQAAEPTGTLTLACQGTATDAARCTLREVGQNGGLKRSPKWGSFIGAIAYFRCNATASRPQSAAAVAQGGYAMCQSRTPGGLGCGVMLC
jgi:hypothetical protein